MAGEEVCILTFLQHSEEKINTSINFDFQFSLCSVNSGQIIKKKKKKNSAVNKEVEKAELGTLQAEFSEEHHHFENNLATP